MHNIYCAKSLICIILKTTKYIATGSAPSATPIKKPDEELIGRFKQTELLAHDLAYTLKLDAKRVTILDEDGIEREYEIIRPDPTKVTNTGLIQFVLYSKDGDNPRVHVLFRGAHNPASAIRDSENFALGGPGSLSFETHILWMGTLEWNLSTLIPILTSIPTSISLTRKT